MARHDNQMPPTALPTVGERANYVLGWWWGFASGVIVGACSAALLIVLLRVIAQALECPTC